MYDFKETSTYFHQPPPIKLRENLSGGSRADAKGQTNMKKLIGAFRVCANAPKMLE